MRHWLLALVLTAPGAPLALARDAVGAIDACLARLDAGLDVGYARIAERCPDLAPALGSGAEAPWLPPDWNKPGNELSAAGLAELRTLLTHEPAPRSVHAPRIARLGPLLAGLAAEDHRPRGGWARVKEWLREVLARRRPEESGWLRRLMRDVSPPQALLRAVSWSALTLVIVLAVGIVANELRIAGLGGRRRGRGARATRGGDGGGPPKRAELAGAAPAEQPRLLLELIVARLREQQRVPPPRALTVHELTRVARLADAERERFTALTGACEQLRFAAREPSAALLAAALAGGRELLAALEPAAPERTG
jgi:hypothetical protein